MASSSGYVPFSGRAEWADVTPIVLDDSVDAPARINYSDQYSDTMNYFRAVFAADELSQRALNLTTEAIRLNAANYTAWHYRRKILRALGSDLRLELSVFIQSIADQSAKNYQLWQHRRVVVGWLGDASGELAFTKRYIAEDTKNYHAWGHRQWAIKQYGLWDGEVEFTAELLGIGDGTGTSAAASCGSSAEACGSDVAVDNDADDDIAQQRLQLIDIRNNSAWNHRWFVLSRGGGRAVASRLPSDAPILDPAVQRSEAALCLAALRRVTRNESGWSYLRAVVGVSGLGLAGWPDITAAVRDIADGVRPSVNVFANEWLAEVAETSSPSGSPASGGADGPAVDANQILLLARRLYLECAGADTIRHKYWVARADAAGTEAGSSQRV